MSPQRPLFRIGPDGELRWRYADRARPGGYLVGPRRFMRILREEPWPEVVLEASDGEYRLKWDDADFERTHRLEISSRH